MTWKKHIYNHTQAGRQTNQKEVALFTTVKVKTEDKITIKSKTGDSSFRSRIKFQSRRKKTGFQCLHDVNIREVSVCVYCVDNPHLLFFLLFYITHFQYNKIHAIFGEKYINIHRHLSYVCVHGRVSRKQLYVLATPLFS